MGILANILLAKALITVALVSSMRGFRMSSITWGLELKKDAAEDARRRNGYFLIGLYINVQRC